MSDLEEAKLRAAATALELVRPGMRLGLGTGSTAAHFTALLGARVAQGLKVICVPTSERTRAQAQALAIPLATLDELPELDLTVDGADEFDLQLRLIKGGGGALLREKIVAAASRRMVVVADESKAVRTLGKFPLPVEINRFGVEATRRLMRREAEACGCIGAIELRLRVRTARLSFPIATIISSIAPSESFRRRRNWLRGSLRFLASLSTVFSSVSPRP